MQLEKGHKEQPEDQVELNGQFPYSILGGPVAQACVPVTPGEFPCEYWKQSAVSPCSQAFLRLEVQLGLVCESGSHRRPSWYRFARAAATESGLPFPPPLLLTLLIDVCLQHGIGQRGSLQILLLPGGQSSCSLRGSVCTFFVLFEFIL